jgi:MraZ protein
VDLFLSTFENRIDKKGRLSVPAPFRAVLERRRDPLYLFKSLTEPCLEGCGPERIGQIVDAIDAMDSLSEEVATLQTMLSSAQEMKLDSEGRIMLSADFIAFAELDDAALYAGIGRSFQIWLPGRYRTREADARSRAKSTGLPRLRLGGHASRHGENEPDSGGR